MPALRTVAWLAPFAFAIVFGCAQWKAPLADAKPILPPATLPPESVVLEIAYAHFEDAERETEESIWREIDEQSLSTDLRSRLIANGLRAGEIGASFPTGLKTLVDRAAADSAKAPGGDDVNESTPTSGGKQRRLQVRSGSRAKIVVTSILPTLSILSIDEEGHVHGNVFEQAQALFSVRAFPSGDGTIRLEITPEVEYGEMKNRWVPVDGALVQQVGKERKVFDRLKVEVKLSPGHTLSLGAVEKPGGIGQSFFTTSHPVAKRSMLLIRAAQTQADDLFAGGDEVSATATRRE